MEKVTIDIIEYNPKRIIQIKPKDGFEEEFSKIEEALIWLGFEDVSYTLGDDVYTLFTKEI